MRGDLERRQDADIQARDELHRQGRVKTRQVLRKLDKTHTDLSDAMAEKEQLMKTVRKGAATLEAVQKEGLDGRVNSQINKTK